ncbi:unnamed protein product (macronuclear) [Paramecium tetraurelia]|uniref:Uncharacterized protein n=1 Tax=Paramecium tetraurelia TaxID=5888 RepID=A0BQM6_PARTE|nr:uncharacterized protein GSPATT00031072001 [Paramecium tetraurelia]CAK60843.1 unnamed protein product [Paramecium tetraurelia]|eukprot:XP_001428241.1 hypothetical protein (macronuclear) [Paramecium tetraurelia strain d4-2]
MYIYLFLIGAVVMLFIYVEIDEYKTIQLSHKQASQAQNQTYLEAIQKQTHYLTQGYIFKINQANDLYLMQNYEEAIVYYNKAIHLRLDNPSAYFYKGNTLTKLEYFEDAIANYNQALKLNSQNDAIYLNKGYALTQLKLFEEAIECYDLALKINFQNDKAYYYKGKALHQVEHYLEAVEYYNKAININSNNQHYYFRKGFQFRNQLQDQLQITLKNIIKLQSLMILPFEYQEIKKYQQIKVIIQKISDNSLLNQDKFDRAQEFKNASIVGNTKMIQLILL